MEADEGSKIPENLTNSNDTSTALSLIMQLLSNRHLVLNKLIRPQAAGEGRRCESLAAARRGRIENLFAMS